MRVDITASISRRNLDRQSCTMGFSEEKKMTDRTVRGQRVFVLFSNKMDGV